MRNRGVSSRTLTSVAVLSLIGVIGLSACGGSPQSPAAAGSSTDAAGTATVPSAADAGRAAHRLSVTADGYKAGGSVSQQADLLSGESVIKTGSVALTSDRIGKVLVRVYGIVGGIGGDVAREDTATDEKGTVVRSTLVLRVPVADFDTTLNDLSRLGTMVDRIRSSKDVTTAVADIHSRVQSAQRSITTLRRLFGRATKLGDIIRLESELSQREADLESLQAQQRVLSDKTTMSTITMTVELPPSHPHPTVIDHGKAGGFASGIREGWHALTRTTLAVGHGLGVVLPLGTVVLLLVGLSLWFIRRFAPRPASAVEPTVEA
jgi:hypothetical protein